MFSIQLWSITSSFTAPRRPFNRLLARQLLIMHVATTRKVGDEGKRAALANPMLMTNPVLNCSPAALSHAPRFISPLGSHNIKQRR